MVAAQSSSRPLSSPCPASGHGVPLSAKTIPPARKPVASPARTALAARTTRRNTGRVPWNAATSTTASTGNETSSNRSCSSASPLTCPIRFVGSSGTVRAQYVKPSAAPQLSAASPSASSHRCRGAGAGALSEELSDCSGARGRTSSGPVLSMKENPAVRPASEMRSNRSENLTTPEPFTSRFTRPGEFRIRIPREVAVMGRPAGRGTRCRVPGPAGSGPAGPGPEGS